MSDRSVGIGMYKVGPPFLFQSRVKHHKKHVLISALLIAISPCKLENPHEYGEGAREAGGSHESRGSACALNLALRRSASFSYIHALFYKVVV